jgi:hypothetical protein
MRVATTAHRDRILELLRLAPEPLDDDELSRRSGVTPRQQVNQICRALEAGGVLRRYVDARGKIVNELRRDDVWDAVLDRDDGYTLPAGSSREQREAERLMLDLLGVHLGLPLQPATIGIPSGARVEVDGTDEKRTVLVECWSHLGPPKPAQRNKVLADAFKLSWVSSNLHPRPRLVLCFADRAAAAPFIPGGRSWAARALRDAGIGVMVIDLPDDVREDLLTAQTRRRS